MKENLIKILNIKKEDLQKDIQDYLKLSEKSQVIPLIDKKGKKIVPFTNFVLFKCPYCDGLHIQLVEAIPSIVYPSTMEGRMEDFIEKKKISANSVDFSKIPKIMEFSKIFVERVIELSKKYITGENEIIFFQPPECYFEIHVMLTKNEKSKLNDTINEMIDIFTRFQNFFSEAYSPIEGYGTPRLFGLPIMILAKTEKEGDKDHKILEKIEAKSKVI